MSKFYRPENPLTPEEINKDVWRRWYIVDAVPPPHDCIFMGREWGTNRSFAVRWSDECGGFTRVDQERAQVVRLIQWITFKEFADIRACVWRSA